ncbi:MAG: MBL fold metallo-hydrolase [Bacillota bacterium]|nr:MBL fold metallo-hydrolase [Bacillota bacterium]
MILDLLEGISDATTSSEQVTSDILLLKFTVVNASIVEKGANQWVLIDTGLKSSGDDILKIAEERFGRGCSPEAIILTHGHFDHIGSVIQLADKWDVAVYAHPLEMPYLTGRKDYPVGDSTVDGGMIAEMSPYFPNESINISNRVKELPTDGTVPGLSGWKWIHTPGHTPGHISLFRESDRTLIVGDAFTTVKQESAAAVITQRKEINGPPAYFTTDWKAAKNSVMCLAALKPSLVIPSHGKVMSGEELEKDMQELVRHFDEIAVPEHGRFVE